MTFITALLLSAFAQAQLSHPVALVTKDQLIVTSAGRDRLCGYLAGDSKQQTVCIPDLAEVPLAERSTGQIKVTSGMFCTYSEAGIRSSGDVVDLSELFALPKLTNVFDLALPPYAGSTFDACALTQIESANTKAVCWGGASAVTEIPKDLIAPSKIATSGRNACALDGDGYIKCWGKDAIGNSPYAARDLRKLVMTDSAACVIDAYGLMCWGPKGEVPRDLATDGYVKDVAIIDSQICALTMEHQVQCVGSQAYDVPAFVNPIAISSFGHTICVTDVDGLKCWGWLSEMPPAK